MSSVKLFIHVLLGLNILKSSSGEGFCKMKIKDGKFESEGDCGNSLKSSVLEELNAKIEARNKVPAAASVTGFTEKACYLGMKNRNIPDSAITASSTYDYRHAGYRGRLDIQRVGEPRGGWSSGYNGIGQWIQVDLGKPTLVAGVITQGRADELQWVTSYKVSCGSSVGNLATITENGADKIFSGNFDQNTKVKNKFPQPMTCRYIRIYPQTWSGYMSMRMELIRGTCYHAF